MNKCVRRTDRIILRENTEVLGKEPFPVLLYPPQIPHRLGLELNLGPCSEKMVGGELKGNINVRLTMSHLLLKPLVPTSGTCTMQCDACDAQHTTHLALFM